MKKTMRKRLVVLIIISLLFHMLPGGMAPVAGAAETRPQNPRIEGGVTEWDCVWFGSYPQSDATGATKEPIKWRVLSVNGDDAFLLADKNLDVQRYNDTVTEVTWETCTMRSWLNSTFLNKAFNESEQAAIKNTTVVNEDNPEYGTKGGEPTEDKVYLLSSREAMNPSYGFTSTTDSTATREATNTAYVAIGGEIKSSGISSAGSTGWWRLRSPGYNSISSSHVSNYGIVNRYGTNVISGNGAVRPALHLNLSSVSSWSSAGTVSSDGTEFEISPATPTPVPTPTPTPTPTSTPTPTPALTPTVTPTLTPPAVSTPTPTPPAVPTPVVTPPSTQNPVTEPPVQTPNADTGAMEDPIVTQSPDITDAPVMMESPGNTVTPDSPAPNNTAAPNSSVTPNSPNGGTEDKEKAETDNDDGKTGKASKTGNAERGKNDSEKNESGKSGGGKSGSKKGGSGTGSEPKTGDETHTGIYATVAMVAGCSYLLLYFADDTRGMTEEEKKRVLARLIRWAKQGGRIRKALALPAIVAFLVWYHGIGKQCVEMGKGKESGLLKA